MNPLASTKCVRLVLMALTAIAGIFLTVGCGGSNSSPATNPVGFSNSSLNGTYVFSSQGLDNGGAPLNVAGTFVANGNAGITGGTIDIVDAGFPSIPTTTAQPITSGSYSVNSDGRGRASLTSAYGTYTLDFVLTSTSQGLVTEFDGNGGGSGTIDMQTAITSLTGSYAFSLAGSDAGGNSFAAAGAFTLNSSGTITTSVEDFNDDGAVLNEPPTGTATLGSGTGPGAIPLTSTSFPNNSFDFYPIDSTHWKIIETDYNNFLAGDAFSQTSTSIPTGTMAFTMSGGISAPVANGGFLTYNGTSFSGSEDFNNNGNFVQQVAFTGAAGAVGPVGGRVVVGPLSDFTPATQLVVYPSSGGLLMLETDGLNVTNGAAYVQQSGAALSSSQAYGFNLNAFNTSGPFLENDIAQFTTASTGLNGVIDISDNFGNGSISLVSQTLGGTYTIDSPATGRGEVSTTANGSGYVSFIFYAVSNDQFLVLETDSIQIGAGTFEAQSASGSAAVSQAHMSFAHPVVKAHAASRRK